MNLRRSRTERNLHDTQRRLARARQELDILDEQLLIIDHDADDARIRALVSETPLAQHDHSVSKRHADAANAQRARLLTTIADLTRRQDQLISQLVTDAAADLSPDQL